MNVKLQMVTAGQFGFSGRARLNPALMTALAASSPQCETCSQIERDVEPDEAGGQYVEPGAFQGRSVQKLDAHFKSHWKAEYELVDVIRPTIAD